MFSGGSKENIGKKGVKEILENDHEIMHDAIPF